MEFSTNYEAIGEGLMPEGRYNCIITSADVKSSSSGEYIEVHHAVTSGQYAGRDIRRNMYKKKDPSQDDMKVEGYSFLQLMQYGGSCGIPSGKKYRSLAQFLGDLVNKPVTAELEHTEYKGKTYHRVKFINPPEQRAEPPKEIPFEEVSDDDLPF